MPAVIQAIQVWDYCPGFRDGPYAMSHVVQECIFGRILRIETKQGYVGAGEVVFQPAIEKKAMANCIDAEADYLAPLIGENIESLLLISDEMQEREPYWNGVAFGLETAYFDLKGKQAGLNAAELLGGRKSDHINDYFSISESTCERLTKRVELAGADRAVIQLKLGMGSVEDDLGQLNHVLGLINRNQIILADVNGGWDVETASAVIPQIEDDRVVWEETCRTYEENVLVAKKTGKPLMFDQCVGRVDKVYEAIKDRIAGSICIKPAFLGGLRRAQEVRNRCAEAGVKMRIDGPWCGDIATAAILHLAAGAPPELLVASCDLREPLVLKPALHGSFSTRPGHIAPPNAIGIGVDVNLESLGSPEKAFE